MNCSSTSCLLNSHSNDKYLITSFTLFKSFSGKSNFFLRFVSAIYKYGTLKSSHLCLRRNSMCSIVYIKLQAVDNSARKWLQWPNLVLLHSVCVCLRESGEMTALILSLFPSLSLWLLRLFETLQSLFWSVFGLLNLYVTNVKARHEFTEFVGATMFGTYNVISLVVLLNMLIAMMNNSYQLIAVSASKYNYNVRVYTALTSIVWDWK